MDNPGNTFKIWIKAWYSTLINFINRNNNNNNIPNQRDIINHTHTYIYINDHLWRPATEILILICIACDMTYIHWNVR